MLALDVPLDAAQERPYCLMVTLEQWLQPVVSPLNAVGAASYAVGSCSERADSRFPRVNDGEVSPALVICRCV